MLTISKVPDNIKSIRYDFKGTKNDRKGSNRSFVWCFKVELGLFLSIVDVYKKSGGKENLLSIRK